MNLHVGSFPLPFRGREKEARLNSGGGGQPVRPLHSGLRQTDGSLLLSFATQQVRQRRIAAGPQLFRGTDGRTDVRGRTATTVRCVARVQGGALGYFFGINLTLGMST